MRPYYSKGGYLRVKVNFGDRNKKFMIQSGLESCIIDELKDYFKVFIKRLIAGFFVFFIPAIINYVYNGLSGNNIDFLVCLESASKEKVESLRKKEEAEAEAEKKAQEREDEALLRKAWEEEQKQKGAKKQSFEEWKKKKEEEERLNPSNNGSGLTGNAWVDKLLSEAKSVTDYARNNNFSYGDAPLNPAINHDAKLVSCDRCVGWFLYNAGYTDQPERSGLVVSTFPGWFNSHGFTRINNYNELKAGDVVFVNPDGNGNPQHVFLLGNPVGNGIWERYDCGSVERIRLTGQYSQYSSQPFKEPVSNFLFAYRAPEASK